MKKIIISMVVIAVVGLVSYFIFDWYANRLKRDPNFASGNGRIEATEINIAARLAGKVECVCVLEGETVEAGQLLVVMQTNVLVAQLAQAEAKREQAKAQEVSATAQIKVQTATLNKMKSDLERTKAIEVNAKRNYERYKTLIAQDATSRQHYENAEMTLLTSQANLATAESAIAEAEANLAAAKAEAVAAKANILAAEAQITSIKADIDDSILKAPLKGRIQYRVAEPGEVLSAGGRALNMVDLTDVYITFFLPEQTAGKVRIGSEVRIVLDAAPKAPLPAKVTYVSSTAQFTPKTVETQVERQKLMFRVKAHVDRRLLEEFSDFVKTGLPGVAWVKLNDAVPWPAELEAKEEVKARARKVREEFRKTTGRTPDAVIDSNTKEKSKARPVDAKKLQKEMKGASHDQVIDATAKVAKQVAAAKEKEVEKNVVRSKEENAARQESASKIAEQAKKADDAARKAPAKGTDK